MKRIGGIIAGFLIASALVWAQTHTVLTTDQTFTGMTGTYSGGTYQNCAVASTCTVAGGTPVISSRAINTTSPLSGGGDLSADRTLSLGIVGPTLGGTGVNNAATSGNYLKGNGTGFATSTGSASGTGGCTNQFPRTLNSDAAPTCASVNLTSDVTGNLAEGQLVAAGLSVNTTTLIGTYAVNTTTTQSPANTSENILTTFTIKANTLDVNGKRLHIRAAGKTANTAATKTVRLRWGGIGGTICSAVTPDASVFTNWLLDTDIIRTGATAQNCSGYGASTNGFSTAPAGNAMDDITPAQTLSGDVTIVITAQSTGGTLGDIVYHSGYVDMSN